MTNPIPTQEFKDKLEDLISNNSKITNPIKEKLIEKLKFVSENYRSKPGKVNLHNIRSITETAFQRGIFNGKNSYLKEHLLDKYETIDWIDLEIPIVLNKNRRRFCIDILGSKKDKLVLCELKYTKEGTNPNDNPMYAVFELLIYYNFVRNNFKELDKEKAYHDLPNNKNFNWESYLKKSVPLLLVTANESYWQYWFKRKDYKTELLKEISGIEKKLQIEIQLFQTENDNYKEQKEKGGDKNGKYNPQVISPIWEKICN